MTKKTGFFVLLIFVFITGTAHLTAMESEKNSDSTNKLLKKSNSINRLNKLALQIKQPTETDDTKTEKELRKKELREEASRAAANLYYDSPCGAATRRNAVQEESLNQQPPVGKEDWFMSFYP